MRKLALYIHIPFCKSKCKYCDFASFAKKEDKVNDYIKKLCKEICEKSKNTKDHIISSIYIGGGTPSYIDEFYIAKIFNVIRKNYVISENAEITIELNPGTVTEKKFECYKEMGINRVSFGLQETHDGILKDIGRIHTYEEFCNNYKLARANGFDNISVDLIFGLPNQTLPGWEETLEKVISLNPEHISAYSLKVEEKTQFGEMQKKSILILPDEEEEREMYYLLKEKLIKAGYVHYEISNFGKPGYESKHNMAYWEREDYFGFGSSAASCFNEIRTSNIERIEDYIENENVKASEEILTEKTIFYEKIILGLRMLQGINTEQLLANQNEDTRSKFNNITNDLIKKGLIAKNATNINLTDKGLDLANYVFVEYNF